MANKVLNKLALGIIEFDTIPIGYKITNEMLKKIDIEYFEDILAANSKYIAIIVDKYEKIEYALNYAISKGADNILDIGFVGNIHEDLRLFINKDKHTSIDEVIDIGVIKTDTFSTCIEKANQILHFADVSLININYSDSLNGDCLITFHGSISNIMASIEKVGIGELISKPDKKLLERMIN
jgi:microcompartment protein CcmL/EutN